MAKRIRSGIAIGLFAAAIALILWSLGLFERIESATWDWRVKTFAEPGPATDNIRLIFLDQDSLAWGENNGWPWPWPRQVYEPVLSFCRRGGAKAVAFDFFYTEFSQWGVDDDEIFGDSIAESGNFAVAIQLSNEQGTTISWPENILTGNFSVEGFGSYLAGPNGQKLIRTKASFPIPEVSDSAAVFGTVGGKIEGEVIRRAIPFLAFDKKFVPSLGIAAFMAAHPDLTYKIENNILSAGGHSMHLDKNGHAIIRYRGPTQTHKTVNVAAVIESEMNIREGKESAIDPEFFKGTYVLFGPTAHAMLDRVSTPISNIAPGVEIHATMLDNFLSDDFIRDAPRYTVFISTIIFALLAGISGMTCRHWWHAVITASVLLPLPLVPGFVVYNSGIWMPVAVQEIAVVLALAGAIIVIYAIEGRQKRFIKNAFSTYLAPTVVKQLMDSPDKLKLGGERREITAFFSDVQGFTGISEKLNPEELVELLNDYLTEMTDIVLKHEGTVDKFEGDAIIAFFGAPLDIKNHAEKASIAAVEMQNRMDQLRVGWAAAGKPELKMRIGLYTGQAVVGNMGSKNRMDYTMMGDTVNTAARLEGVNKIYGIYTLVGETTHKDAGDSIVFREIDSIIVVGKEAPVAVYEPLGFKEDVDENTLKAADLYIKGLNAYRQQDWDIAIDFFNFVLEAAPDDAPSKTMIKRCEEFKKDPPEKGWNGAYSMKTK